MVKDLTTSDMQALTQITISGVNNERVNMNSLRRQSLTWLGDDLGIGNEVVKGTSFGNYNFTLFINLWDRFQGAEFFAFTDTPNAGRQGPSGGWNSYINCGTFKRGNDSQLFKVYSVENGIFLLNINEEFAIVFNTEYFCSFSYDSTIGDNGEIKLKVYSDFNHNTLLYELKGDAGFNFSFRYKYYLANQVSTGTQRISGYAENFELVPTAVPIHFKAAPIVVALDNKPVKTKLDNAPIKVIKKPESETVKP